MNLFRLKAMQFGHAGTARVKCPKCRSRSTGAKYHPKDRMDYYCHDCAYTWSGPVASLREEHESGKNQ